MGTKKAEFYVDFLTVEKVAKKYSLKKFNKQYFSFT
jgi:hypothetical protein